MLTLSHLHHIRPYWGPDSSTPSEWGMVIKTPEEQLKDCWTHGQRLFLVRKNAVNVPMQTLPGANLLTGRDLRPPTGV